MRVAILGPWPSDGGAPAGGVMSAVVTLARGLAQAASCEVHVLTLGPAEGTARQDGVHVRTIAMQPALRNLTMGARDVIRLRRAARALHPDVTHGHGLVDYGLAASALPRHLVTVHGLPQDEAPHVRGAVDRFRWWTLSVRSRACLARARHVTVPTAYARARIRGATRAVLHDLANPVDARYFDLPSGAERPFGRGDGPRVLCVSRLIPLKRIEDVLAAFERIAAALPGAALAIAGGADDTRYATRLEARAAALPAGARVEFLGQVEPDALVGLTGRAHLVLHASAQENAPIALEQSLAAGVPVVAARAGGIASVVRDGETGLLAEPGDPAALAAQALALLTDPGRYRAVAEAARADARARFHPHAVVARALELYARVRDEAPHTAR